MRSSIRRIMIEASIKRIKKQLESLEAREAQSKLQPAERTDETYLVLTYEDQKKKLLKDLEKYQKMLEANAADETKT